MSARFSGQVVGLKGSLVELTLDAPGRVPMFTSFGGATTIAQPTDRTLFLAPLPPARPPASGTRLQADATLSRKELDDAALADVVSGLAPARGGAILETGIKALDFLCPLRDGGVLGVFGGLGVGATVLLGELIHRLKDGWQTLNVVYAMRGADVPQAQGLRAQGVDEGLGDYDRNGKVTIAWVPASSASDPGGPDAAVAGSFHAALLLSPGLTVRGIYPAVDGLRAASTALTAGDAGGDHVEVWRRYREALGRTRELMADVAFWELVALKSRRAGERFQAFEADRLTRLAASDRQLVTRVRKVERYLTQPFHIAAPFTGMPGQTVARHETVRTVAAILDGRFDHVPDQALTFKGSVQP